MSLNEQRLRNVCCMLACFLALPTLLLGSFTSGHAEESAAQTASTLHLPEGSAGLRISTSQGTLPEPPKLKGTVLPETEVVVDVDGKSFTLGALLEYWKRFDTRPLWNRANLGGAVNKMVNDYLIARKARATEGFMGRPEVRSKIFIRTGELWRDFYWEKVVRGTVTYTDQEVMEAIPAQEDTVTIRQLLISNPEQAKELRARVVDGKEDFEKLIEAYSEGMSKDHGGVSDNLKATATNYPTEVLQAAFSLRPLEYSPVFQTPIGSLFFRIEAHKTAEEWRKDIFPTFVDQYLEQKAREVWAKALMDLTAKYSVIVNEETVKHYNELSDRQKTPTPVLQEVLFTVDGSEFLLGDVMDPSGAGIFHGGGVIEARINSCLENYAIQEEIRKLGVQDKKLEQLREFVVDNVLAREYLRVRAEGAQVEEEEIGKYYEQEKEKSFSVPVKYRYSIIETRNEDRLKKIRAELAEGKTFEAVAKEWSDHPSGKKGGDLGFVDPKELKPEFRKMSELPVGEIMKDPVVFRDSEKNLTVYSVIMKTEIQEAGYLPLDDSLKQVIAVRLMAWKRKNTAIDVLTEVRGADTSVVVKEDALDRYEASLEKPEEPKVAPVGRKGQMGH